MPPDDKADTINALIDAVEAIEHELGIRPSGVYADVRVRLDILEARINNPFAPAPNVENPFFIGNDGVTISTGVGFPTEDRVSGSLYLRQDGYTNEELYAFRPDGYWHLIDGGGGGSFTAGGDLTGTETSQTVAKFQGTNVSIGSLGAAQDGYALLWNNSLSHWEPRSISGGGFTAAGDLTGSSSSQTVSKLQNTTLTIGSPSSAQDGYTLTWNNSLTRWEPLRPAVVFDTRTGSTNLRSTRLTTQSPINNAKVGIVNLGSDSNQTTTGVTADYASVLGGDRNTASGTYGVTAGGLLNANSATTSGVISGGSGNSITSGDYSVISGGFRNSIAGTKSFIGGGDTNSISGDQDVIVAGISNNINITFNNSTILNGQNNTISSNYSTILGGNNNTISSTQYSMVWGTNNNATANFNTVFGQGAKGIFPGQIAFAARTINGTVGASQYSKVILDGSGLAGASFTLTTPDNSSNLTFENGKSYDINARILINNTSGSVTCARFAVDILAHCESGTLILDVINTTLADDNGTNWNVSFTNSTNQLVVTVTASGSFDRRAIATLDWRELSRL